MIRDLRDWLAEVENLGELKTIREQIDWDQEMTAITYMLDKTLGPRAPAVLFEDIKGYGRNCRVLLNTFGPSPNRVAMAMGMPPGRSIKEYIRLAREKIGRRTPPVEVDPDKAPVNQNIVPAKEIDLTRFPAPKFWPRDGGRYIGTGDVVITKDPGLGFLNLGTYRIMLHNKNEVGLYMSPGKDGRIHLEEYWRRGQAMEVAICLGVDPTLMIVAGWGYPKNISEYEFAGGIKGEPIEVVKGLVTDLWVPARAEIVIEGIVRPGNTKPEGPFGEFTGYYGRPESQTPVVEVRALRFRNNPIMTCALMAEHPACEHAVMVSIIKSALILNDLEKLGIPGIKDVYAYPAAAASYGMTVVSLEQKYAGHAAQVLSLVGQVVAGGYYTKWVIAVEEDVDIFDVNQVLWAMSTRCNPVEDIDIQRNTWSTYLDPTQNPPDERPYGSKAYINACREHKYLHQFAKRTKLSREVYDRVAARWKELGLPGEPSKSESFESGD
jgi:UbiD family decarboxylase